MWTSLLLLTGLWWLLTEGDPTSWVVGAPTIGVALIVRHRLNPLAPWKISLLGAGRYLLSFFKLSFVSGVDVVRRALHPRLPMNPGLIEHRMRLRSPAEKLLAAGTVNLLPGTLSADLDQDRLTVHTLDITGPVIRDLQQLERLVAGLGASLPPAPVSDRDDHE